MKKLFITTSLFLVLFVGNSIIFHSNSNAELPTLKADVKQNNSLPTLGVLQKQEQKEKAQNNAPAIQEEKTATTNNKAENNETLKETKEETNEKKEETQNELKTIKTTKEEGITIDMSKNKVDIKKEEIEMKKPEEVKDIKASTKDEIIEIKEINDGQQKITDSEQETINTNLQTKAQGGQAIKDGEMGKLITIFNIERALNYNYNSIKYNNSEFLENASEFKIIKQLIKEQRNPEIKKKKEEEKAKKKSLAEAIRKGKIEQPFNGIHLTSLLFFSPEEWTCRIDGQVIKSENRNKKGSRYSIVKVNKTSIVFVLKKTTKKMIKQVEKIVEDRYPYYQNYFTTEENGQTHIGFKLFVGQKIDFDTMRITG